MKKKSTKEVRNSSPTDQLIEEALQQAALDAVHQHQAAGQPMVTWKDGKTALIRPEEVLAQANGKKRPARGSRGV